MSANVWFEEVDRALIVEVLKTVQTKSGVYIPDKHVIVRKPDEDYKIEVFPCVSIYNTTSEFDYKRYKMYGDTRVSVDEETSTAVYEKASVPYNLSYQLDFWAKKQTEMNVMLRTWLYQHSRQFNLDVVDDGGTARNCNVKQSKALSKSDLLLEKQRLFHSIIFYDIWVEIDEELRYTTSIVKGDVHTEVTPSS